MRIIPARTGWQLVALSCVLLWAHALTSQSPPSNDAEAGISVRMSAERTHYQPGEDVRLHVEIWNEGKQDVFIFKNIDAVFSNSLATLNLLLYNGSHATGPNGVFTSDSFSSERASYPPLAKELPRYWIPLPPRHFYGQEVVMPALWFSKLSVPGKYRIQGKYRSRGFLAQDINNPLLSSFLLPLPRPRKAIA